MADPDLARCHPAYAHLKALHHKGKLPHAILLTGLNGVGKKATAIKLAMAFNCHRADRQTDTPAGSVPAARTLPDACGNCPACRQIATDQHPDIIRIRPAGGLIKIGQIRELLTTLAMKPFGQGLRVVIIEDASAMNPPAANAILKILEEPPDRTVLILTAVQAESMLSTIRSRCQQIRLAPLTAQFLQERLLADTELPATTARVVANLAQGSYARAREMARPEWLKRRSGLVNLIALLPELTPAGRLVWADMLARDKGALEDFLEITQSWLRDLLAAKSPARSSEGTEPMNPDFMNKDYTDLIQRRAAQLSPDILTHGMAALGTVRKALRQTNPNPRLLVETMLLGWGATTVPNI